MKIRRYCKLDQKGFSWHFILPLLVIVAVAAIGLRLLGINHAQTPAAANGFIYYNGTTQISPDGQTKRSVGTGTGTQTVSFSPDGAKAAYAGSHAVYVTAYAAYAPNVSTAATPIYLPDGSVTGSNAPNVAWSPDGQWLAFGVATADSNTGGWNYPYSIGLAHPDGTGYTTVPGLSFSDSDGFYGVSWVGSSSPNKLLYIKGNDQMCTINMDGTGNSCVALSGLPANANYGVNYSNPQVSPDGTKVLLSGVTGAYQAAIGYESWNDIYEVNIDGSSLHTLTGVPAITATQTYQNYAGSAVWSPDGRQIAFAEGGEPAIAGLYTMNADGSNEQRLDTSPAANIAWQPVAIGDQPMVVGSCAINGLPASPTPNSVITPTYTITNTSPYDVTLTPTEAATYGSGSSQSKAFAAVKLASGASTTLTSQLNFQDGYVAAGTANATFSFLLTVAGENQFQSFSCQSKSFALPVAPATGYCAVQGVPTTVRKGASFTAKVVITNNSISAFTPVLQTVMTPNSGSAYDYPGYTLGKLAGTTSTTKTLPAYKVSTTTKATGASVKATVTGATKIFTCSVAFKITN